VTAPPDAARPLGGTWDAWVRALSASLAPLAHAMRGLGRPARRRPFLCVITPVFDPARASLALLIEDLRRQTFGDFVHVMVSNGASPDVAALIAGCADGRFVYDELPARETPDAISLLVEIGRRRRHALAAHAAERYVFLDADAQIVDERYFARLYVAHALSGRDLILALVRYYDRVLPEFPIAPGRIDMANFTFSAAVARAHPYPDNYDPTFGFANDYRFWTAISAGRTPLVLDTIGVRKDGHKGYARLTDRFIAEAMARPGTPPIRLFDNSFDQTDVDGVADVLRSHRVGPGPKARELERRFAELLGFAHAVSTSTATGAFWLLARALDLDGSTEVIVPNIHGRDVSATLRLLGVPYRVADVGPGVPNLTPEAMLVCLSPRTRAVVALDYGGCPADVPGLRRALAAAGRSDVALIGDASDSLFTRVDGSGWAHHYDHALVSLDADRIVVTGDGGLALTDDAAVAERVRRLASEGLDLLMNDVAGSLGLTQLARVEEFLARRRAARDVYLERLAPLAAAGTVELSPTSPAVTGDLYRFWIKLPDRATRDGLARALRDRGVHASVNHQPIDACADTPNAHDFSTRALCLPLHQNVIPHHADYVMTQVVEWLGRGGRP
jgi:dTDP-4-dehydro-2,3,6-trideoxy-D-glucose 4-aminotransferase